MEHLRGGFGWVDLLTDDVKSAREFYPALFGWEAVDLDLGQGPAYTFLHLDGVPVAGLGRQPAGIGQGRLPPRWNAYVVVDDLDATLNRVGAAGGTMAVGPTNAVGRGRIAVLSDPDGVPLGLFEPGDLAGSGRWGAPGAPAWVELHTHGGDGATAFYSELFGWRWERHPGTGYCTASLEGLGPAAGAIEIPEGVAPDSPSQWVVHFGVTDCAGALARAEELGGTVFLPAMEVAGRVVGGVMDAAGAQFMVVAVP
jgi:uncharacterized protein